MRKLTLQEFVTRANCIHGDKYNYSKVDYKNMNVDICVVCCKHGDFHIKPYNLLIGRGCPKCLIEKRRTNVQGVGINDIYGSKKDIAYKKWSNMIVRCYNPKVKAKYPTYKDCFVCDDWLIFSNFKKWFDENYVEGYELDKDILFKNNKCYSPDTCCYVPRRINLLLINRTNYRGNESIGVAKSKYGRYESYMSINGKRTHLGTFDTELQAFEKYKQSKEDYIKSVAKRYYQEGKINSKVYEALTQYEVDIND